MNLYKLEKDEYLKMGALVNSKRPELEAIAEQLHQRGYDNLFLTGVGGTTAEFTSMKKVVENHSSIPVYCVNAAELMLEGNKQLSRNSIVITGSKSGDTKETVAVVNWCKERGIETVAITKADTPLAAIADHVCLLDSSGVENTYLSFYYILLKLAELRGEFPDYAQFVQEMEHVHEGLVLVKEKFEPVAAKIAKQYHKEEYQMWVGSGTIWGDVYMFTMCILEEMQWKRTKAVSSPEFFHGSLELVDEDTLVILVKGVDACRPLDERVEKFLNQYAEKKVIIDLADYKIPGVDEKFADICGPMVLETITTGRLAAHWEHHTGHSLAFRRYYRQFDY